jgi:beta-glucuronidase
VRKNEPNFDFFNYAGLHRPVKIYTTPQTHIEDITVVPEVFPSYANVNYKVETNAQSDVQVRLLDAEQNVVAETTGAEGTIEVQSPHLWQPLNAYLYNLEVSLIR